MGSMQKVKLSSLPILETCETTDRATFRFGASAVLVDDAVAEDAEVVADAGVWADAEAEAEADSSRGAPLRFCPTLPRLS